MSRLAGRVALVTGASRSIGRAIATAFAREGADVAVNYTAHEAEAGAVVHEIQGLGRRALAVRADVAAAAEVRAMVERVVTELGRIDVLVNNAGVMRRTPFLEIGEEEWDRILAVNLKGPFLVAQAVARGMIARGSGAIVNISSIGHRVAAPSMTAYNTAKAGVVQLTRQLALELAPYGIRVNAVAPGLVETDMNRRDLATGDFRQRRLAGIPLGRLGAPEDVVGAALYLASDESRWATGALVIVDGGQTIL